MSSCTDSEGPPAKKQRTDPKSENCTSNSAVQEVSMLFLNETILLFLKYACT